MTIRALLAVALATALAGCLDAADTPLPEVSLYGGCPRTGCGNQARLDGGTASPLWVHELRFGAAGDGELRVESFRSPGGDALTIVGPDVVLVGGGQMSWAALIGSQLVVLRGNDRYTVSFRGVELVDYVSHPSAQKVPFYDLKVRKNEEIWERSLCDSDFASGDAAPAHPDYGTLFIGDRYDLAERTVHMLFFTNGWFNIACAGTPMAQMHLERLTTASAAHEPEYASDLATRQERFLELTEPAF